MLLRNATQDGKDLENSKIVPDINEIIFAYYFLHIFSRTELNDFKRIIFTVDFQSEVDTLCSTLVDEIILVFLVYNVYKLRYYLEVQSIPPRCKVQEYKLLTQL